jgi:hypothetical protein
MDAVFSPTNVGTDVSEKDRGDIDECDDETQTKSNKLK